MKHREEKRRSESGTCNGIHVENGNVRSSGRRGKIYILTKIGGKPTGVKKMMTGGGEKRPERSVLTDSRKGRRREAAKITT